MELKKSNIKKSLFEGKVVILYLKNPPEAFIGGIVIKNPHIEEFFGRSFLIGESPFSPDDWTSGLRTGISFDQVAHFLEFSDENEYLKKSTSSQAGESFKSVQGTT